MAILSKDTTIDGVEILKSLTIESGFTIGTSTSGWTEGDCDYLCDGVDDQIEINQALSDLPDTGGEIVILDGTYNITGPINIAKDSTTLSGNGNSTVLKRMWNSSSFEEPIISVKAKSQYIIQNLYLDGNKSRFVNSNNVSIYIYRGNKFSIINNICNNSRSYSIYVYNSSDNVISGNICTNNDYGIYLADSFNNNITGNTYNNNINYGIYLVNSSKNNTITGNTCNNNIRGIYLNSCNNNTISGNTCNNSNYSIYLYSSSNNTIVGNTCNNNTNCGIYLGSSTDNIITGNTYYNNGNGIYSISCNNNTITGNTCNNNNYGINLINSSRNNTVGNTCIRGTGLTSDYTSSQYTIYLDGTNNNYNLIAYNNIMGKNYTSQGGTGNTFTGNKYS